MAHSEPEYTANLSGAGGSGVSFREALGVWLRIGLVSQVFEPDDLLPRTREALERILENGPVAVAQAKRAMTLPVSAPFHCAMMAPAAEVMKQYPVHACTDITGFGLMGHLAEMLQGTGLGLAIASQVLADHRAFVRVRDNRPHGTRFVIEFPFRRAGAEGLSRTA